MRFASGADALDAAAASVVDEAARVLRERTGIRRVALVGYCDGEEGDDAARESLGERRAVAVRDALVARGIDLARLTAGSGPTIVSPHAPTDESSRAARRKVTLGVIEPGP